MHSLDIIKLNTIKINLMSLSNVCVVFIFLCWHEQRHLRAALRIHNGPQNPYMPALLKNQ